MRWSAREIPASGWRAIGISAAVGMVGALLIIAMVSLSPIRFDVKAYRNAIPEVSDRDLEGMRAVVLVTSDAEWPKSQFSEYGLDAITFPDRKGLWILLTDGNCNGPLLPDLLVNARGEILAHTGQEWYASDSEQFVGRTAQPDQTLLLCDSSSTGAELVRRLPLLGSAHQIPLKATHASLFEGPRLRGSVTMFVRLTFILSTLAALAILLARHGRSGIERVTLGLLSLPCLLGTHVTLSYLLFWTPVPGTGPAFALELTAIALLLLRSNHHGIPLQSDLPPRRFLLVGFCAAAVLGAISISRLDYDGDLFTHWLPSARSFHEQSGHDLRFILERYGPGHEAAYPPGFPIAIATTMWAAGVPAHGVETIFSNESHAQVLLYRILITAFCTCFLGAFLLSVRRVTNAAWSTCGLLLLLMVALLPQLSGKPSSAEVLLVPFAGLAMAALFVAGSDSTGFVRGIGVFLAASTLMLKNESILVIPFVILPWLAFSSGKGRLTKDVLLFFAGALPFGVWRTLETVSHIDTNFPFYRPSLSLLIERISWVPALLGTGGRILLATGAGFLFAYAAVVWIAGSAPRSRRITNVAPLIGAMTYICGTGFMYVFSNTSGVTHMLASWDRLLGVAIVSTLFWISAATSSQRSAPSASDWTHERSAGLPAATVK